MKLYNLMKAVLLVGTFAMTSCSQDEEPGTQQSSNGRSYLQISVTDAGVNDNSSTRAIENGYETVFVEGDAIGVYGIKNGAIEIENKKFTLNKEGKWEILGSPIEFSATEMGDTKFYAYYPYQADGVKFNSTVALSEDPFAEEVSLWEIGMDLDVNYTNYDLMTSKVTVITPENNMGKLDFVLNHRMSIASISLSGKRYEFLNEPTIDTYSLPAEPKEFKLKQGKTEKEIKPYYDEAKNLYRILVKPNVDYQISGIYSLGEDKAYQIKRTVAEGIAEGKAIKYTVGSAEIIKHLLQIGDYYCADGSIIGNESPAPENAIGVVYFVGNPQPSVLYADKYTETSDVLRREFPNCTHGLVIALNDANDGGTAKFSSSKKIEIDNWMKNNYAGQYIASTSGSAPLNLLGYNNTRLMLKSQEDENVSKRSDVMCNILLEYSNPTPSISTGWFCPSFGDFTAVINNYEIINKNITSAGGVLEQYPDMLDAKWDQIKNTYWTSSVRNSDSQWITGLNIQEVVDEGKKAGIAACSSSSNVQHFRFCLAF